MKDFGLNTSYKLKAAPLVFEGKKQYNEYMDVRSVYLHELMKQLGTTPFFLSKIDNDSFVITKASEN